MSTRYRQMPRRILALGFVLAATSLLGGKTTAQRPDLAPAAADEIAEGAAFSNYRQWKPINAEPIAVPDERITFCRPASQFVDRNGPHVGGFINVYVNSVGREEYLGQQTPKFTPGSVIVKEKLFKQGEHDLRELGVMVKREAGFAPDDGDWQYLFVDSQAAVTEARSKLVNCAHCHQTQAKNDYVFRRTPAQAEKGPESKNRASSPSS